MKQISFCITCMNRLKHLQETLEKNILGGHLSFLSPDIARWKLGRNGRGVSGVGCRILITTLRIIVTSMEASAL